jgi:hypothetical protein
MKLALPGSFLLLTVALRAQIIWDFPQPVPIGEADVATVITLRQVTLLYQAPVMMPPAWTEAGTKVRLQLGTWAPSGIFNWYHDGRKLAASGPTLDLGKITASDAGAYVAILARNDSDPSTPLRTVMSETITLRVGQPPRRTLVNVSTLAHVTTAQPVVTTGFVVGATGDSGGTTVLIRAVGPSLGRYLPDPLAAPRVRVFDASGADISVTVVSINGTDPVVDAMQKVGAFPLIPGAKDFAQVRSLLPGAYTVQVSSSDGGTGAVLLEVYEMP